MRKALLPYARQAIDRDEIEHVAEVLSSEWITTGPKVPEFERAFADYVGSAHAVSFSSGTAALHAAAFAAGLGPSDEAITTPLTFCATANSVLYQGATPVFAEIRPDTLNIDPESIARAITSRTKAVLPVDYAGQPADLDAIIALAREHRLVVIEDACHALGAEYKHLRVGSHGHMAVFSFHPAKHITTGEGGMVTTSDGAIAARLRMFRNHGIDSEARERQQLGRFQYQMVLLGYNYRLTDFASALGLMQLRKLPANLARRRHIAARYQAAFRSLEGVATLVARDNTNPSWHLYPIRVNPTKLRAGRDDVLRALRAENIGVNVHYTPVHLHRYYRERFGYSGGEFPVAEDAAARLISLPMFPSMTDQDVEDVIVGLRKVVSCYAR